MCHLLLLACLVLGQIGVRTPPELVAEALRPRPGAVLAGQPMGLGAALGSAALDRPRQFDAIRAYWRLAEAVGQYGVTLDLTQQLEQLAPRPADALLARTAQASAIATLRDAELAVIAAQYELLTHAGLAPGMAPPLPSDKPHAGPYRTNYQQLQVLHRLSARAALVDQTLPIRRRAMDTRAAAVSAAEEAARATAEAYRAERGDCSSVLARLTELRRQRLMFLALVRQYNDDIADYALEIAAPTIHGPALVALLIEPNPSPVLPLGSQPVPAVSGGPAIPFPLASPPALSPVPGQMPVVIQSPPAGSVIGASATLPSVDAGRSVPVIRPGQPVPTAAPRGSVKDVESAEPAPLPPSTGASTMPPSTPPTPTFRPAKPPATAPSSEIKVVPVKPSPPAAAQPGEAPTPRKVNRPDPDRQSSLPAEEVYRGLVGVDPAVQARQLTAILHSNRALPQPLGRPLTLADCLSAVPASQRAAILESYWRACAQAARYQAFIQQAAWLTSLDAAPGVTLDAARAACLRASRHAAEAEQLEGQAALLEAEFQLAVRLDWRQPPWPLPTTPPHCGPCPLELKPLGPQRPEWRLTAELVALVPKMDQDVAAHAAATVAADGLRAALTAEFRSGALPVERLIAAVHRQTDETLGLVRSLADYNRAIGQYALAVLPPQTPGDRLATLLAPAAVPN